MFKNKIRSNLIYLILSFVFLLVVGVMYRSSVFRISQNFAVVEDQKLYRSAQLTDDELKQVIEKYHIKTVISLRGSPAASKWYSREEDFLKKQNVQFEPINLSDDYYPDQEQIRMILNVFKTRSFPMLVHCRVGADRTGMVSALYQRFFMNESLEKSLEQLSFRYWHVRFLHPAMTAFVEKAKSINWLLTDYNVCSSDFADYRKADYVCH